MPQQELGADHLMVGEQVRYKRPELAVEAFNRSKRKLVVIGGGEMLAEPRALAGPTVSILGPQPFAMLQHHDAHCLGLIYPGEEDFDIVPVDAMARGRPVIAFGRGGATETVIEGVTGTFFHEQTVEALFVVVERCDAMPFDAAASVRHAAAFGKDRFKAEMSAFIDAAFLRIRGGSVPRSIPQTGTLPLASQSLDARPAMVVGDDDVRSALFPGSALL